MPGSRSLWYCMAPISAPLHFWIRRIAYCLAIGGGTSLFLEQKGNALPFYLRKRGRADSVPPSVLRDLGSLRAYGLAARGGACMRGQAPQTPPRVRVRGSAPPCAGVAESPAQTIPESTFAQTWARKGSMEGSMEQSVHRPLSQSVFWLDRRVNSAIRERGRLDLLRRPRAPVVTDCYIDPSTRTERTSHALRQRLRRRSRAAARPTACADTRAPSALTASRAC